MPRRDDDQPVGRTKSTIQKLVALLQSSTAAEELHTSWHADVDKRSKANDEPRLSNLYNALDAGRTISYQDDGNRTRGIPMWIVVRTCKAKWHQDGTWPLLGSDEIVDADVHGTLPPRSTHPSRSLIRPPGTNSFAAPTVLSTQEPSAEEIAQAYRRRGIKVEEAVLSPDLEDW